MSVVPAKLQQAGVAVRFPPFWINKNKNEGLYYKEMTITPVQNKRAKLVLRESEERLRLLLDSTAEAIYSIDLAGNCTLCNSACVRLLGYDSPADLLGKNMHTLIHHTRPNGMAYPVEECRIYQAFLKGEGTHVDDEVLWRKDGTRFPVEYWSYPIRQGNSVVGSVTTFLDITVRKEAQEAQRKSEAMFEELFESSPDATLVTNQEGRIVQINSQVEKLFGYKRGELLDELLEILIPERFRQAHPDKRRSYHTHSRPRPMGEGIELWGRRKDGSEFPAEIMLSPLQAEKGKLVLSVVRDITLRRQAEKALQETHERLNIALRDSEQHSREASKLTEMVDILHSCQSVEEACKVVESTVHATLPSRSGALCITRASRNVVEAVATWGQILTTEKIFSPDECWALRRGKMHRATDLTSPLKCAHVREFPAGGYLCVPLAAQGEMLGVLYLEYPAQSPDFSLESLADPRKAFDRQATALGERISFALANLKLREALRSQSIRDPLTGLFNRRYMEETFERELRRAARNGRSAAILMLDIDHFKQFNDTFGHQAGDALLRGFGDFLNQRTRGQDVACRYGGEEFALILSELSMEDACKLAERMREDLKELTVHHAGQLLGKITLSIGISTFPGHGATAEELVRAADRALYRAKSEGRDRAVVA